MLSWVWRTVPTVLVLALLGAVAYWGHVTGWDFTGEQTGTGDPANTHPEENRPLVRIVPVRSGARSELPLPGQNVQIEFPSASAVETIGIDLTPVWMTALTEQVAAAGEVMFDSNRVARLSTRVAGVTRKVMKTVGDPVRAGDVLVLIESAEVGRAKTEFQQALVQARFRERARDDLLRAKEVASPVSLSEAQAAVKESEVRVQAAAQSLTNLGLPVKPTDYRPLTPAEVTRQLRLLGVEDVAGGLDPASVSTNLLPVRAPFAGVVLRADVVSGDGVEAGKILFVVVDPVRVWVTLHVGGEEARRVAVGQKVFFRPDGSAREYPAAVVWVGTAANEATRTIPVRAEADNAAGVLRASTLGRGRVVLRDIPKTLVVPHEAVHRFQGQSVVFVRDPDFLKPTGPKTFHVRVVRVGGKDDRNTEILSGLTDGEIVATKGSDGLLGKLTRSSVGR